MLFFRNTTRFVVFVIVVVGVILILAGCGNGGTESRTSQSDSRSQSASTWTSTPQASRSESKPTNTPTAEEQTAATFTVNRPVVNVRQGPGTNFAVIGQVTEGDEFAASGKNQAGDWLRFCCVGGGDGWIYKPLLIVENEQILHVAQAAADPSPKTVSGPSPTPIPEPDPVANDPLAGIRIVPENRCSPYDSDTYSYSQSVELQIIASMGGSIYSPYTGQYFQDRGKTDIEHVVARSEAHDSGLCGRGSQAQKTFAGDLLNLTLADPSLNRHQKSAKDLAEWLPGLNQCWFVKRVIDVKRKYDLSMDTREAEAARRVWGGCTSFEMIVYARTEPPTPTPIPSHSTGETNWLAKCDSNGNGRITCKEAEACGISHPVPSSHPAYQYMRDADGDGQVCE